MQQNPSPGGELHFYTLNSIISLCLMHTIYTHTHTHTHPHKHTHSHSHTNSHTTHTPHTHTHKITHMIYIYHSSNNKTKYFKINVKTQQQCINISILL
jgi:hypothetical protein